MSSGSWPPLALTVSPKPVVAVALSAAICSLLAPRPPAVFSTLVWSGRALEGIRFGLDASSGTVAMLVLRYGGKGREEVGEEGAEGGGQHTLGAVLGHVVD